MLYSVELRSHSVKRAANIGWNAQILKTLSIQFKNFKLIQELLLTESYVQMIHYFLFHTGATINPERGD
jgi:hypothetical protein